MSDTAQIGNDPYHHGDLANACVRAALSLLNDHGLSGVTLREVARCINASRSAPYRHFADKRDLLAACAQNGFARLAQLAEHLLADATAPDVDTVRTLLHGYARFGAANPHLYRLMFASDFEVDEYPALTAEAERAFYVLQGAIRAGQQAGTLAVDDRDGLVLTLWSSVHGLVSLHNELPTCSVLDTRALEANLDRVLDILLPALQPAPVPA
ncbi:TetR/AcrR family transcriptional regulator [Salinisphaera sp.]|mgnify:CR=1 FL=1|uniref:TetR/AcrR family transcriptional regulator n=1 Tax=Salinisphaera sp. TaxID=1914330 RepID=UPI000C3B3A1D|nr:TetR/AcrR family transcriptional regulator [Salinisphaera sp.]MAS10636.1 TetR family transcriptional regulator [Salinisphaera sp.]